MRHLCAASLKCPKPSHVRSKSPIAARFRWTSCPANTRRARPVRRNSARVSHPAEPGREPPSGCRGILPKSRSLIEHELALIAELHYEAYFLTVWDLVRFARSRAILCQGRGSAANSAVCYCLGVTSVDPEQIDVLFERFVSRERKEAPDIDVDFEHERREEVLQYIYDKYGRERAGMAAERDHLSPSLGGPRRRQGAGPVARSRRCLAKNLEATAPAIPSSPERCPAGIDPRLELGRQLVCTVQRVGGVSAALGRSTSAAW